MQVLAIYIEPAPYILDLIRVMRQQYPELRLRVLFISASTSQPWDSRLDDGVSVLLPVGQAAALKQTFSEIRKGDFDWLHLAGWGHPLLMSALLLGVVFRRNISVESDTQLPVGQNGWKKWIKDNFYPRLFSWVNVLFPGGTRQKEYFLHYGVPEEKIRIGQMTVDVTRIFALSNDFKKSKQEIRASIGLTSNSVVYVFVGRLEEHKGIYLLLDAFKCLDDGNIRLLIVGDGSCRTTVEQAAALDSRICYVGRRDFAGVVEAFSVSDVAVVPSSFEPWGLVVNEAMAAGLPVIVTNQVGCADDLVQHKETGLVLPSMDVSELLSAMKSLAGDHALREQMGAAGVALISGWKLENGVSIIVSAWQEKMKL